MVEWRFQAISEPNYNRKGIPVEWQAWHDAWFNRISAIAEPDPGLEPTVLLETGCTTDDWQTPNCTRTCSDATAMFGSAENLWNCVSLASVAMAVASGNDTVDDDNVKEMNELFHIGGTLADFDGRNVFAHVRECFLQSCADSTYGRCTPRLADFRYNPIDQFNWVDFSHIIQEWYCDHRELGIDSDIAGPGVLFAYAMQHVMVILALPLFKMATDTSGPSLRRYFVEDMRAAFFQEGKRLFLRKVTRRFAHAVYSATLDLHEAQTLFIITFTVISLIAFADVSTGLADLGTVTSYVVNGQLSRGLVKVGMYPALILQIVLHRSGKRWGFTLLVVMINWALILTYQAIDAQRGSEYDDPAKFWRLLKETSSVPGCGDNPGPMSFCDGPSFGFNQDYFFYTQLFHWHLHIMAALLILDSSYTWLRKRINIMILGWLLRKIGDAGSWSFGQFMALTVWLPVITKFIYSFLVGSKKGTEDRIHDDLEVREIQSTQSRNEGEGESEMQLLTTAASQPSVLGEEETGKEPPSRITEQEGEDISTLRRTAHTFYSPLEGMTSWDDTTR